MPLKLREKREGGGAGGGGGADAVVVVVVQVDDDDAGKVDCGAATTASVAAARRLARREAEAAPATTTATRERDARIAAEAAGRVAGVLGIELGEFSLSFFCVGFPLFFLFSRPKKKMKTTNLERDLKARRRVRAQPAATPPPQPQEDNSGQDYREVRVLGERRGERERERERRGAERDPFDRPGVGSDASLPPQHLSLPVRASSSFSSLSFSFSPSFTRWRRRRGPCRLSPSRWRRKTQRHKSDRERRKA